MKSSRWFALALLGALLPTSNSTLHAANPLLFVTQQPMPNETNSRTASLSVMNVSSAFGNQLGGTSFCGRGGSLYILYPGVTQPRDLLAAANYGPASTIAGRRLIAARQPCVYWDGTKALFSLVMGGPANAADTTPFYWQIYEIANFGPGGTPTVTRVPGQPAASNNVSPIYGTDDHVIFTTDLPRGGAAYLYPQRDEYLLLPVVTGLWSLDPVSGAFRQLQHSPSGSYTPLIDSFGRLLYSRWDHLSRDAEALTDRGPGPGDTFAQTFNGTFNYTDEAAAAGALNSRLEIFPEPRPNDLSGLAGTNLNGNAFNQFFPWMITEDGTGEETLNHVGRHEIGTSILPSFTNDPKLVAMTAAARHAPGSTTAADDYLEIHEDPLTPGRYYASSGPDTGTHGAGQLIRFDGGPSLNPALMQVTYLTPRVGIPPAGFPPLANPVNLYKTALPLTDGRLVTVQATATAADTNQGTATAPLSAYSFRLRTISGSLGSETPGAYLTPGITASPSYYTSAGLTTYSGTMWELDPAEVVARPRPARIPTGGLSAGSTVNGVASIEAQVFTEEGVDLPTFQSFLRRKNLALVVSRNVSTRDGADRQQPFNLKVTTSGSTVQTLGSGYAVGDKIYGVGFLQFLQADQLRGLTFGTATPAAGRRVLPTPMHDVAGAEQPVSENPPVPAGAPAGSVAIAADGSMASFVPGGRAVTYHLLDPNSGYASQVKERYWLTFAAGEVRTCASCHGVNQMDQTGVNAAPVNKPSALRTLLQNWKANHPLGVAQCANASLAATKTAPLASVTILRAGGDTGSLSVNYATADGTALAGQDYTATGGVLTWADGDVSPRSLNIALLGNPVIAASKTFAVNLSGASASVAAGTTQVTVAEPPFGAWRFQKFGAMGANDPAMSGPGADPDGDGTPNLLEYAVNSNPLATDSSAGVAIVQVDPNNGNSYLTLNFHRRLPPLDITYHAEFSTDLLVWSENPSVIGLSTPVSDGNGITESVRARAVVPVGQATCQFIRLRVTLP